MTARTFIDRTSCVGSVLILLSAAACGGGGSPGAAPAPSGGGTVGASVLRDWTSESPGSRYLIRPADLPTPTMLGADPEASVAASATVVPPPAGATPKVPDGFTVRVFASGLKAPRNMQVAPNGDIFLAEFGAGRVLVFRRGDNPPAQPQVFAEDLDRPYGIAFLPPANPQWVYIAAANQVVRYPYRSGTTRAGGPAEVIVPNIPTKRHSTRALVASRDGQRLFLAVGSASL